MTVSDIEAAAAGISGLDTARDQLQADACFSSAGISRFLAINDGYLPIAAENPAAWGVSLNCGTGMCCAELILQVTGSNWPEWMNGQGMQGAETGL